MYLQKRLQHKFQAWCIWTLYGIIVKSNLEDHRGIRKLDQEKDKKSNKIWKSNIKCDLNCLLNTRKWQWPKFIFDFHMVVLMTVKFLSISDSNLIDIYDIWPSWDLYHVILLRYVVLKNKEIHNKLPYVWNNNPSPYWNLSLVHKTKNFLK